VPANLRPVTGTFLKNIFEGAPAEMDHPRWVERYLKSGMPAEIDTSIIAPE